jgi:hypothetical protein
MITCRVLILLVLVHMPALARAEDFYESSKACQQVAETLPSTGLDPDQFEREIEALRQQTLAICKPAAHAVAETESNVRTFEDALAHLTQEELLKPVRGTDGSIST